MLERKHEYQTLFPFRSRMVESYQPGETRKKKKRKSEKRKRKKRRRDDVGLCAAHPAPDEQLQIPGTVSSPPYIMRLAYGINGRRGISSSTGITRGSHDILLGIRYVLYIRTLFLVASGVYEAGV